MPVHTLRVAADESRRRASRRRRRLGQEFAVRVAFALLILAVTELLPPGPGGHRIIRTAALLGVVLNLPYFLLA